MAKVILAGATGLIGRQVLQFLTETDHETHIIARRHLGALPSHVIEHVAKGENWPGMVEAVKPDIAISCLGTTIGKAGSQAAFRAVDFELVSAFASAARKAGASSCILVSSTMAEGSASNFYLKTKGEAEDALVALGFDRLDIIRPGLLKGDRSEFRLAEKLGILVSPLTDLLLQGSYRRYRSIDAEIVAAAIVALSQCKTAGHLIHENDAIHSLAAKLRE